MKLQTRLTALVSAIIILISAAIGLFAISITENNEVGRVDSILNSAVNQLGITQDDPLSLALLLADQSDLKFTVSYISAAREITALNQSSGDLPEVPVDQDLSAALSEGITLKTDGLNRIRAVELPDDEFLVLSVSLAEISAAKSQNVRYLFIFTLVMVLFGTAVSNYLFRRDNELNEVVNSLQKNQENMREFLGDASHELRTPLTVIKGYVELLGKNKAAEPARTAEYYERIAHEIERMQSLINDLLFIAELEDQAPIEPEIINFSREVAHLSNDLKTLQPSRPIETKIQPGILVNISHNYAQQMLANIFANLRRHTPEDSQVLIDLATAGNKAVLTISDAGSGLPEEVYKSGIQYFQRFDRSRSRESGGSGLGMTIMKRIIENANGSIELRQSQFGGLEIKITLPISRDWWDYWIKIHIMTSTYLNSLKNKSEIHIELVCLGNICRSPMAAAVLHNKSRDLTRPKFLVSSSGTSVWHKGEGASPSSVKVWESAGYKYEHVSRPFSMDLFDQRDLILTMDLTNRSDVLKSARNQADINKVMMLRSFDPKLISLDTTTPDAELLQVPDPWGQEITAYREVFQIIDSAIDGLIQYFKD